MAYQLSNDPGVAEIESQLALMQKSMSPDFDLVSDFRATLKHAEPLAKVAEAAAEAMVKLSNLDVDPSKLIDRTLRGVTVNLDKGVKHSLRLNHGPLEPVFPGHCHATIIVCVPFGEVCIEIEMPWWCLPGAEPGDSSGTITIF